MDKKIPLLTIAIPTYNRCESLKYLVEIIKPQLSEDLKLLIIDNNSEDFTSSYCKELMAINSNITFIKNLYNFGGVVNMLKCVEYSNSKFTWLLGDDDDIDISYLSKLLALLREENAYSFHIIPKGRMNFTINQFEFLNKKDFEMYFYDITAIHLMSSNIYNTKEAKKYLKEAYNLVHLQHAFTSFHAKFLENNLPLRIICLPIMKQERLKIKRWSKFTAHLDALETTSLLFGDEATNKEYQLRKKKLFNISTKSLFIEKDEGFNEKEIKRLFRLIKVNNYILPIFLNLILFLKKGRYSKYLLIYFIYISFFFKDIKNYKRNIESYFNIPNTENINDFLINNINKNKKNFFKN